MKCALFFLAAVVLPALAFGTIFSRCQLAREMFRLGVPKCELPIWTCIAEHESSYNTAAVGPPNSDGSRDHGIFQINDLYWCNPTNGRFSHNYCAVLCSNLRTNDITLSVSCAQQVLCAQGWTAWTVYNRHCSGRLESVDNCF